MSIPYLKELMKESDVISLSEHWLQPYRLRILNEISDDFNVISRSSKYADSSDFGHRRGQGILADTYEHESWHHGESVSEHKKGKKYRNFVIGAEKVPETEEYDHVGIKNCLFNNYTPRIDDRISKGRRAFHSVSGPGIRKKGVNMTVCSYLYWSIIIPIVTYGSELWVMKKDEIESLQRYLGRKCQRFPSRSPNYSACAPLGWISIEKVIFVKKMMFFRTILIMEDDTVCKKILLTRTLDYINNTHKCSVNERSLTF